MVVNQKVSVISSYNYQTGEVSPRKILWNNREYKISRLTYHHKIKEGNQLFHIFHVTDGNTDFSLKLNTENLHWTLEEIYNNT